MRLCLSSIPSCLAGGLLILLPLSDTSAADAAPRKTPRKATSPPQSEPQQVPVQRVASQALESVVVVSQGGGGNRSQGVGAGFVISKDGLVATSLHVIGEGLAIDIQTADGQKLEPMEIHAWDRRYDLAVLRVKGKMPPPLPLGDSSLLKQGDEVVAIGNPMGLERSVVRGVASATREIENVEMIQVAIPIEPGNSGGPLLDNQGRVVGIMALKSAMTANLGFAVPSAALQRLLDRPNSVSIDRWMNMDVIDSAQWETRMGARWKQKVDRIVVEEVGDGFGGRSLCLSKTTNPQLPFELAVTVRLDDEAGAAGLVFGGDGEDRHYGFYPTAGQLRLTRFDGPNVFSWNILQQASSDHYQREQWNRIKVRVDAGGIKCFVNGHEVFASADLKLAGTRVGLCKFRTTRAEFRQFTVGQTVDESGTGLPDGFLGQVDEFVKTPSRDLENRLAGRMEGHREAAMKLLEQQASQMERNARVLRKLARQSHARMVGEELRRTLTAGEAEIDLVKAALLVAQLDDPELDVTSYRTHFDRLAGELRSRLPAGADDRQRMRILKDFFYRDHGFHGSRHEYYDRNNSYLNRVMEQREGIPITLSMLFMELGKAVGLKGLRGHPMPGHFMVAHRTASDTEQVIDVFEGGRELTHAEVDLVFAQRAETTTRSESLEPAKKRDIIIRMIRNLQGTQRDEESAADALRYLDLLLTLQPGSTVDRLDRARTRARLGDVIGAREDIQWLVDHSPPGVDPERLEELLRAMEQ